MASRQENRINSKKTIKQLIDKYQSDLPRDELEQVLTLVLHKKIEYIYKNPDKLLPRTSILSFQKLVKNRLTGWSLASLRGFKEFYGIDFLVNRCTLVPRPESELLVEVALKNIKKDFKILDIGTGSGCLILSVAKNFPSAKYTAVDISSSALKIARTNARKLKLKNTKFIQSNLLAKVPENKFDIIIANLPYLTPKQMSEPSIQKEPKSALVSGKDGLKHYQELLGQLPKYLNKKYLILLEIDPNQKDPIEKLIKNTLPASKVSFLKDLAGNIRVAKINS
jgi:release factor glutamine methyltransferase